MFRTIYKFFWICFTFQSTIIYASDSMWLQIETHPTRLEVEERALLYSSKIDNINIFSIKSGWYAIAIGPLEGDTAQEKLTQLKDQQLIPFDSFISRGITYDEKIWPPSSYTESDTINTEQTNQSNFLNSKPDASKAVILVKDSSEDIKNAFFFETQLPLKEKKLIQSALKWTGHYKNDIDGLFGKGTRASISAWQRQNGLQETGILTTNQKRFLIESYNAPLNSLGLETITDRKAGISVTLPLKFVGFKRYSYPLVHFESNSDPIKRVYLISKEGDTQNLSNLFKALQTLDIMPAGGEKKLNNNSFEIFSKNYEVSAYATANISKGEIKGFILIWPNGDEDRRKRLLKEIKRSFTTVPGTLSQESISYNQQNKDLLFGLETRKPKFSQTGVFVSSAGHVVTDGKLFNECDFITLEDNIKANIVSRDTDTNIVLLKPEQELTPIGISKFSPSEPKWKSQFLAVGYSYEGRLKEATIVKAQLEALESITGDKAQMRLNLNIYSGDYGAAIINQFGSLEGILVRPSDNRRNLPNDVHHAIKAKYIKSVFQKYLGASMPQNYYKIMKGEELAKLGRDITTLVSCWPN